MTELRVTADRHSICDMPMAYWNVASNEESALLDSAFLKICEGLLNLKTLVVVNPGHLDGHAGEMVVNVVRFMKNRPDVELHAVESNDDELFGF